MVVQCWANFIHFMKCLLLARDFVVHGLKYQCKETFIPFSFLNFVLFEPEKLLDIACEEKFESPSQPVFICSIL